MPDIRIRGLSSGSRRERLLVELSREDLQKFGECFIKILAKEAKIDFAKRGWPGRAPDKSAPLWESFSYRIKDNRTVEIFSTFPGLDTLTADGVPPHKMVVPIEGEGGTVIFRTAPLQLADAWIHPGIARFTFLERAIQKVDQECVNIFGQAALDHILQLNQRG